MYVDKIMRGHNLMQAITRTNRVFKDKSNGMVVDYIGIGDQLSTATQKYTQGGGRGKATIDFELATEYFYAQLETCRSYLPTTVDYSNWGGLSKGERFLLAKELSGAILKNDDTAQQFMVAEKKMTGLLSIVKNNPEVVAPHSSTITCVQHVSAIVRKAKSVKSDRRKKREHVKELISQSIDSEDIIDVFAMAGIERPDISILNDDFLLAAKQDKSGAAIKVEMLRNILLDEIKLRLHKNIKHYTSLKEEIEKVIARYHANAIDSYTTILTLVEQAKAMQNEDLRVRQLGLDPEELAFYDILHAKKELIQQEGPIQDIVHAIVKAVTANLQLDWTKKENAKATIRLAVKRELRGKVSMQELNDILAEVMAQAEGQWGEWPMVG